MTTYLGIMNKTFLFIFLLLTHVNLNAQVTIEHDTNTGEHNSLVQVDTDTYLLAYAGEGISEWTEVGWISHNYL